jgi:hypothetical protein
MKTITGVFASRADAEHAVALSQTAGVPSSRITLLTPGAHGRLEPVPTVAAEQPGMGKAVGGLLGAAAALSGGGALVAAMVPGVGTVTALGWLGVGILTAAGAGVGAVAGERFENAMTDGLPEDEIFVYEDALRKGRSVVVALAESEEDARQLRTLLDAEGAEAIDAARDDWWIGLRSAEQEHYSQSNREFSDDEKFYRLGFEAALHARTRCKEFDQVHSEMLSTLEDIKRQYPGRDVDEPFTQGYQRGRAYYQHLCDESKAA